MIDLLFIPTHHSIHHLVLKIPVDSFSLKCLDHLSLLIQLVAQYLESLLSQVSRLFIVNGLLIVLIALFLQILQHVSQNLRIVNASRESPLLVFSYRGDCHLHVNIYSLLLSQIVIINLVVHELHLLHILS